MARRKYPGVPNSFPRRTILKTSDLISRSNSVSNLYLTEHGKEAKDTCQRHPLEESTACACPRHSRCTSLVVQVEVQVQVIYLLAVIIRNRSYSMHFLQMLGRMIRVDHFILCRGIVASKNKDRFSAWMVKRREIVNDSVNGDFIGLQRFESGNLFRFRRVSSRDRGIALPQLVRVGGHGLDL
jgi:hypothetical protein